MQEPTGYEERERAALAELGRRRTTVRALIQAGAILVGLGVGIATYRFLIVRVLPETNPYVDSPFGWVGLLCIGASVVIFFTVGTFIARHLVRLRTPRWRAEIAATWQLTDEQLAATTELMDKARL